MTLTELQGEIARLLVAYPEAATKDLVVEDEPGDLVELRYDPEAEIVLVLLVKRRTTMSKKPKIEMPVVRTPTVEVLFDHEPTPVERSMVDQQLAELGYAPAEEIVDGEHGYRKTGFGRWKQMWVKREMPAEPPHIIGATINSWTREAFVSYLLRSLIPDLNELGREYTAQDFETAVAFMQDKDRPAPPSRHILSRPESSEERVLSKEQRKRLDGFLEEAIDDYGGQLVLMALGQMLQNIESAGNAFGVGKAIEALAEVEW